MPWGPGQSVTTGSIATNLGYLFVFGATDSGKNLVTSTTYTATLSGGAAYGSDLIGTYVGNASSAGYLTVATTTGTSFPNAAYSYFLTFSRESAPPAWAGLFEWGSNSGGKDSAIQRESTNAVTRFWYANSFSTTSGVNVATITASTEYTFTVVLSGTTMKVFYKGGSTPITITGTTTGNTGTIGNLAIGGWSSGEWYPGRFRAYGRWSRALSDAEAQSMADNPQQIITAPITYTYARPSSDITTQWTPSTPGAAHYTMINETTPNDTNYIYSTAAGQTDEVGLQAMSTPVAGTSLTINYRVIGVTGTGASVTTSLYSGATLVKADTARTTDGTYAMTVTSAEWASVSNWSNMRLRFVSA